MIANSDPDRDGYSHRDCSARIQCLSSKMRFVALSIDYHGVLLHMLADHIEAIETMSKSQ
jgi:hypothetical protein